MGRLKHLARVVRDGRLWHRDNLEYFVGAVYHRNRNAEVDRADREHLVAAAQWLCTAQDASTDGGVAGRYYFDRGWSSSYPETTGYILPTFLALATRLGDARFHARARACLDFLLPLQLDSGAFPGMEIAENRTKPSFFNTAQILHGLTAWHRAEGDPRALEAARRAADWILAIQESDGAFRRHCYGGLPTTYTTHASCWIAEFGAYTGDSKYLVSAGRHLDWALLHRDPETGWFDLCGFGPLDHADRISVTHTIAYTLWGVLFTSEILGREDGMAAVRQAAVGIARRLEMSRRLPGVLDHRWKARANYVCLTGNAQMALIWLRLHERQPDLRFLNAALKALDGIKSAQRLDNADPGLRGGVAGSDPPWGGYIYNAVPNWAAKFFIDALIEKERALVRLEAGDWAGNWTVPPDVPRTLPGNRSGKPADPLRVVLYTSSESNKPAEMVRLWQTWGFQPSALVVEHPPEPSAGARLRARLRDDGIGPILRKFRRRAPSGPAGSPTPSGAPLVEPAALAGELDIPIIHVDSVNSPAGLEAVRALRPDLAVHAGAGILRAPLLGIPSLGTLNAHMGILPMYRGMNVAEWAALAGDPVGCTVHLVDPGIDTGPIVCIREVAIGSAHDITSLRGLVDEAQLALLGEVLRYAVETGTLPPVRTQQHSEGRQFFRMHEELRRILDRRLADNSRRSA